MQASGISSRVENISNISSRIDRRPYLSVVAASRNDDHGGDPLIRTQIFINNFAWQCEKYCLSAEIVLVDWNPVGGRPGLAAVLTLPRATSYCQARIIVVPTVLHNRLKYADKLSFFQMIAKNVGIRRSRGQFILATNIDILFSDELMQFIAKQQLDGDKLYRVDRYDIKSGLNQDASLNDSQEYAWANPVRTLRRFQPEKLVRHLYGEEIFKKICLPEPEYRGRNESVEILEEGGLWQIRPDRAADISYLHTNACGDFTLLSREAWYTIRGYPEFEAFSFHIDSLGMAAAHYAGYTEVSLLPPCVCFHIEHGIGSGWTPEGEEKLFSRLRNDEILTPAWPVLALMVDEMRRREAPLQFNHAKWGMADFDLPEEAIGNRQEIATSKVGELVLQAESRTVSAIQPSFDLDRMTLAYERKITSESTLVSNVNSTNAEKVVLYIPDESGSYSEQKTIATVVSLVNATTVLFHLEQFDRRFPLRLDPCQCPGFIIINEIAVFDTVNHRLVWESEGQDSSKLHFGGTAILIRNSQAAPKLFRRDEDKRWPLHIVSTGLDPQVILPTLPEDVGFPLIISIGMKIIPRS